MSLSYMELLYLAAYWILVYEYVVMRHKVICAESDARIYRKYTVDIYQYQYDISGSMFSYWNRGTK